MQQNVTYIFIHHCVVNIINLKLDKHNQQLFTQTTLVTNYICTNNSNKEMKNHYKD